MFRLKWFLTICTCMVWLTGCAGSRSRHYFIAAEPSTQQAAIYKVTAELSGWGAVKYKLNVGYVPVNVIDALSGKVGEPPDLFAEQSKSQLASEANTAIDVAKTQYVKDVVGKGLCSERVAEVEDAKRFFGALKDLAGMTDNELISVGQTCSSDPYGYRKLVFYVSTEVIQIRQFEEELNELDRVSSDLTKALVAAKQAEAQAAKARIKEKCKLRQAVLQQIEDKPDPKDWKAQDILNIFASAGGCAQ